MQASRQVPAGQQQKGAGAKQRVDGGGMLAKASANLPRGAKRKARSGARAGAATQELSQEDLKSVTSLLSMIRENTDEKGG